MPPPRRSRGIAARQATGRLVAGTQKAILATLSASGATQAPNTGNTAPLLSAMSERAFQRMVVDGLVERGYTVWTFPEMRFTKAGVPDLLFWHPDRPGWFGAWELKREQKYRVSPEQQAAIDHLMTVDGIDARIVRPSDWQKLSEEV